MTSRLKQGVVSLGVRTGTKLFEKGKDIAKFGFNLFSTKKAEDSESQDDAQSSRTDRSDSSQNSAEPKTEPKTELKWVIVYQTLHKMLATLGYEKEIQLESFEYEAVATFSLDKLVLREILESRDPQIIRHLLIYAEENPTQPHIAKEHLFNCLIDSVKAFYQEDSDKTCLQKNFFVFHSFAKGVLDLLQEHTNVDSAKVDFELRLLDATYYLAYNCLMDTTSVGELREFYEEGKLV